MKTLKTIIVALFTLAGIYSGRVNSQEYLNEFNEHLDKFNNNLASAITKFSDGVSSLIYSVTDYSEYNTQPKEVFCPVMDVQAYSEKENVTQFINDVSSSIYTVMDYSDYNTQPKEVFCPIPDASIYSEKENKTTQNAKCTVSISKEPLPDANPASVLEGNYQLTSGYGYRKDPFTGKTEFHSGVDLAAPSGTAVHSVKRGVVAATGYSSSYGKYIVINHGNNTKTKYAHLSSIFVSKGESVQKGEIIGKVGSTGRSTGSHLHFELIINNKRVNPNNRHLF